MILVTKTCVCVCVFTKLHITAQSGPVMRVILCHSHWSPPKGGSVILLVGVCVCFSQIVGVYEARIRTHWGDTSSLD